MLQQTPLAEMDALPSDVIVPPLDALLAEIAVTAVVVRVGTRAGVVKVASFPYVVPKRFVAAIR